ncbi:MAG: GTPase ObgE, partial [Nitrosomonadales bacterium]|nr:GTPase ObgE [Nitrosomonadales bacterium]
EAVDPVREAKAIVEELRKYDEGLYNKPRWLILNKVDMLEDSAAVVKKFVKDYGWDGPCFPISAISGIGTKELVYAIMEHLDNTKRIEAESTEDELPTD